MSSFSPGVSVNPGNVMPNVLQDHSSIPRDWHVLWDVDQSHDSLAMTMGSKHKFVIAFWFLIVIVFV